jgi:hypothetical protein
MFWIPKVEACCDFSPPSLELQDEEADGFFEVGLALDRLQAMLVDQQALLQLGLPLEEQVEGDTRDQEGHEEHHKRDTLREEAPLVEHDHHQVQVLCEEHTHEEGVYVQDLLVVKGLEVDVEGYVYCGNQ